MNRRRTNVSDERPLDILGISEMEERAYQFLLAHPSATTREISRGMRLSMRGTQRLLDAIEAKGLVTHSLERFRKYIPAAPDIAMEEMILKRQRDLQAARLRVQGLQRLLATSRHDAQEQLLEVITSREAECQALEQMQNAAQHEVVSLIRLPLRVSNLETSDDKEQQLGVEARARGVQYRSIVDAEYLSAPGAIDRLRRDIASKEEARVFAHVPFKMVCVDGRTALVPLQDAEGPALLVRSSVLLDALYATFETLWERSAPLSFTHKGVMKKSTPSALLSQEAGDVLSLLTIGLNDKAIALQLNISTRTLARRIDELQQSLDARTRFQAGWFAAQRFGKL
jgi:sugar-specific transcriptional regulator TrmB